MRLLRHVVPALVAGLFGVVPLCAQDSTGSVAGKILDGTSQQPLFNVEVAIPGSPIRELTRAAGVEVTKNNGEPGAGTQILIRGGSSISNTNDPLYVIDGVPIYNQYASEPPSFGVGGSPPLPRNPLNLLNPADISSITILKDASATAIYGSRAANGVILVETRKAGARSEEHTSELQSQSNLVC